MPTELQMNGQPPEPGSSKITYLNVCRVSPNGIDAIADGTLLNPFKTIQAAVDYVSALTGGNQPVLSNPWVIKIATGVYDETVIVRAGYIDFEGELGARLVPTTGPGIVYSNATVATLAAWLAGGPGNYEGDYGDLAIDAAVGIGGSRISNLTITPVAVEYPVVIAGVGAGNTLFLSGMKIERCYLSDVSNALALYARLINILAVGNAVAGPNGIATIHNLGVFQVSSASFGGIDFTSESTDDAPAFGTGSGDIEYANIGGNITQAGDSGGINLNWCKGDDFDAIGAGTVNIKNSNLENVTVSGTNLFAASESRIDDLDLGSGIAFATFTGGHIDGALTDPDVKLAVAHSIHEDQRAYLRFGAPVEVAEVITIPFSLQGLNSDDVDGLILEVVSIRLRLYDDADLITPATVGNQHMTLSSGNIWSGAASIQVDGTTTATGDGDIAVTDTTAGADTRFVEIVGFDSQGRIIHGDVVGITFTA